MDFNPKSESAGSNKKYFVRTGTITEIIEVGNDPALPPELQQDKGKADLSLTIKMQVPKKDGGTYESTLYVNGKWQRDANGMVTGKGSAFKVLDIFNKLKVEGIVKSDEPIPAEMLQACIGKQLVFINYKANKKDGTVGSRNWDLVQDGEWDGAAANLEGKFIKACKGQYPPYMFVGFDAPEGVAVNSTANEVAVEGLPF